MAKESALIESIVNNLKSGSHSQNDVGLIVRWQIDALRVVIARQPSFGMQAENKNYGSAIEPLVRNVLRKIKGMPEGTRRALLVFSAYSGQQLPRPENLDFDLIARYERAVLSALEALQKGSATIKNNKIGGYHTLDRTKHFCAATGFELIVGLEAGEPTNGDPFRFITNSLFEIVVPEEVREWRRLYKERPDLRSQCEKVLTNWRSDPAHKQLHSEGLRRGFAEMIAQKSASSM